MLPALRGPGSVPGARRRGGKAEAEEIDPSDPFNGFDRGNDQIPLKRRNTLKMSGGENCRNFSGSNAVQLHGKGVVRSRFVGWFIPSSSWDYGEGSDLRCGRC